MHSDRARRSPTRGFTLVEVMLAFALLGMVLAATYTLSIRGMKHQTEARLDYERAAVARALLDEYVATYPAMPSSGSYKGTWDWTITESPQAVLEPTAYDDYFRFIRVTARVTAFGADAPATTLFVVVARRGDGV